MVNHRVGEGGGGEGAGLTPRLFCSLSNGWIRLHKNTGFPTTRPVFVREHDAMVEEEEESSSHAWGDVGGICHPTFP